MIQKLPFRTGVTDLSEDELRLLDVLFAGYAPVTCLRRERFLPTFNERPHNLDDVALIDAIEALCVHKILSGKRIDGFNYVGMTKYGGRLWSCERCPAWERYATDRYGETVSGKQFGTVVATSETTRDDFVKLGGLCLDITGMRVRTFEIRRHDLIYWRSFPCLFAAVVMNIVHDYSLGPDWKHRRLEYDRQRTWWRNVFELQTFLPAA